MVNGHSDCSGAVRDVGRAQPRLETTTLVEAVHPRILSAALKHDVMAIHSPSLGKRGLDYGTTVPLSFECGVLARGDQGERSASIRMRT